MNHHEPTDPAEDVPEPLRLDGRGNGGGDQRKVDGKEVNDITGDVGESHGSSGVGFGFTVVPGRGNVGS